MSSKCPSTPTSTSIGIQQSNRGIELSLMALYENTYDYYDYGLIYIMHVLCR